MGTLILTILWIIYFVTYLVTISWIAIKIFRNKSKLEDNKATWNLLLVFFISLLSSYFTKNETLIYHLKQYPFLINILIEYFLFIHLISVSITSKYYRLVIYFLISTSLFTLPIKFQHNQIVISQIFEDFELLLTTESVIAFITLVLLTSEIQKRISKENIFENPIFIISIGFFIGLATPIIYNLSGTVINYYRLNDYIIINNSAPNKLLFLYISTTSQFGYILMIIFTNRALNTIIARSN